MTLTLGAVALAALTLALLWEEWSWQRHVRRHAQQPTPTTLRCLCCDGAPLVDDIATHTRLAHGQRAPSPEDSREWAS